MTDIRDDEPRSRADGAKTSAVNTLAGLFVVIAALLVLLSVSAYALRRVGADASQTAIATAAIGVIGTIVGAFFGIKVATDTRRSAEEGRENAEKRRDENEIKVEELSAALNEEKAREALDRATERVRRLR